MNGHGYDKTHTFPSEDYVPKNIDTFAFAYPNDRGYAYLKLWDLDSHTEEFGR
jgi:hypothetical protein